jgi:L,D-transpeptidase ErfK/SrfK
MPLSRKRIACLVFTLLWFAGFTVQVHALKHLRDQWTQRIELLETEAQRLTGGATELRRVVDDTKLAGQELEFLQSLVNIMPQQRSFIRTQAAMATEVDQLRQKLGRRIKNYLHILVDTRANKLYVKKGLSLLWEADCSVGRGGVLTDKKTGRRWEFVTPRGQFEVRSKLEKPLWIKPDWAFVETGDEIPPPGDAKRKVQGELGGYVLNLGDGYLIHGTKTEQLLGRPASHGCVRLGPADLQKLYETVPRGTLVYIY